MTSPAEEKARVKRVRTDQAVQFAMQSRWDDAITANKAIIVLRSITHPSCKRTRCMNSLQASGNFLLPTTNLGRVFSNRLGLFAHFCATGQRSSPGH